MKRHLRRRSIAVALSSCLAVTGLAACGSNNDAATGTSGNAPSTGKATAPGGVIKVGQIVTEGGPVSFPTSARPTVKAVFDRVNAAGGIDGNKLEVTAINDASVPQNAVSATRKLIGDGVVAFVGGDSLFDCSTNAPLYKQANVYSVGLGISGACFSSPNYASVGNSPATTNATILRWASTRYGSKICMLGLNYAGFAPQYKGANKLLADMGLKLTYQNTTIPQDGGNPVPVVLAAERAGCQAATINFTPAQTTQALQTVKRQGLKLRLLGVSGQYSDLLRKGLGSVGEGYILSAQMEPWHIRTDANAAYVDLLTKNHIGLDEFSTAAYISAEAFVAALKTIHGPITRESVGKALTTNKYDTTMLAEPFSFNYPAGRDGGNAPNVSTKMIQIVDGKFKTISDFITIPENARKDTVGF